MSGDAFLQAVRRTYPTPPTQPMEVTERVEIMCHRFSDHLQGKERLTHMGYFCLTAVEKVGAPHREGARSRAAIALQIDLEVLDALGDLTETGDLHEARKVVLPPMKPGKRKHVQRPLTGVEKRWIQEVVKSLIRRVAEFEANPTGSLTPITMADFPTI